MILCHASIINHSNWDGCTPLANRISCSWWTLTWDSRDPGFRTSPFEIFEPSRSSGHEDSANRCTRFTATDARDVEARASMWLGHWKRCFTGIRLRHLKGMEELTCWCPKIRWNFKAELFHVTPVDHLTIATRNGHGWFCHILYCISVRAARSKPEKRMMISTHLTSTFSGCGLNISPFSC